MKLKHLMSSKIFKNFSLLSFIQVFLILIPLLYYPYLIRVFGGSIFGQFLLVQSIVLILAVFIDFGFNLHGTKIVAQNSLNTELLSKYVTSIYLIKLVLLVFVIAIYLLIVFLFIDDEYSTLALSMIPFYIGEFGYAMWYFQGREQVYKLAIINLLSKFSLLILVFLCVSEPEDLIVFSLIFSLANFMNGALSIYYIFFKDRVRFMFLDKCEIKQVVLDSGSLFLSRLSSLFILRGNSLIVGVLLGPLSLSYYDLAMKFLNLGLIPLQMLNQALYPSVARTGDIKLVLRLIKYLLPISLIVVLLSWLLIEPLIVAFAGDEMINSVDVWFVLSLIIPLSVVNYFLGNTVLIIKGQSKLFNNSVYIGSLVYLFFVTIIYIFSNANLLLLSVALVLNAFAISCHRVRSFFKLRLLPKC